MISTENSLPDLQDFTRLAPQPSFYVRDIPVYGDLVLAPMDSYSDLPFRLICRELGSAMSYTEFVNVINLQGHGKPQTISAMKLKYDPSERPMTFQIYGYDEDMLVETAARLQELGPDIIDLNMGCYVKAIARRGAGSGMLLYPDKIGRVFARLSKSLHVPVTGKIRLGWDDDKRNYVEIAHILEDNGASLIAVHGRTKAQAYQGNADWDAIAEVKQAVKIPVLGNGDVRTVADIERMRAHTGCDGVMIARAAIGNPWIFSRLDHDQVTSAEKIAVLRRHLALNLDFYGPDMGLLLFRKHAAKYVQNLTGEDKPRVPLFECRSLDEFDRMLAEIAEPLWV